MRQRDIYDIFFESRKRLCRSILGGEDFFSGSGGGGISPSSFGGGGVIVPSVFAIPTGPLILNISNEGTVDWIACNNGAGNSLATFESTVPFTWKTNGTSRGRFTSIAIDPNETGGNSINTLVASPLELTQNAGDARLQFSTNPSRNVSFSAPGLVGATPGAGHQIIYPGDGALHTFNIYVWTNKPNVTVTMFAHMLSGSAGDISVQQFNTNAADGCMMLFKIVAKVAFGDSIAFTATVTNINGQTFCGAGIQAITVF